MPHLHEFAVCLVSFGTPLLQFPPRLSVLAITCQSPLLFASGAANQIKNTLTSVSAIAKLVQVTLIWRGLVVLDCALPNVLPPILSSLRSLHNLKGLNIYIALLDMIKQILCDEDVKTLESLRVLSFNVDYVQGSSRRSDKVYIVGALS